MQSTANVGELDVPGPTRILTNGLPTNIALAGWWGMSGSEARCVVALPPDSTSVLE